MFKIIAISCIFAAVSLNPQNVKGVDAFSFFPIDITHWDSSLLGSGQSLEHLKDSVEKILQGYATRVDNATAVCTKVYYDGVNATQQLSSILNSCLQKTNETIMIESEIQHLMDLANGIKKNLTKDVQDIVTKCLHNPVDITSCVTTINHNLAEINLSDLLDVVLSDVLKLYPFNLVPYVPNVVECYRELSQHFNSQYLQGLLADTRYCLKSIAHVFVP